MISVSQAVEQIRHFTPPPRYSEVPLPDAQGKVLATDLLAPLDSPPFPNSAMDGFAVRWSDVQGAASDRPVELTIVGESQAGLPFSGAVHPGEAVRINTGALVPEGADTVIPVEECAVEGERLRVLSASKPGQHIRRQGEEFRQGDLLLSRGTLLEAPQLALLASCGVRRVDVFTPPAVSIIVTGRELVPYDQDRAPFQIHDSNSIMLQAAVRYSGGRVSSLQQVTDELEATVRAIEQAAQTSDLIVLSGGVSVGPHDHVKSAAQQAGFQTVFWKVSQKPGKPFYFAVKGTRLLFGLPGNPVSAFMGYVYYLHPLIAGLCGRQSGWPQVHLPLTSDFRNNGKRTQFLRIRIVQKEQEGAGVEFLPRQGSHMILSIARADGFVVVEPEQTIRSGELIEVYLFPWRTEHGLY